MQNESIMTSQKREKPGLTFLSGTGRTDLRFEDHYKLMNKLSKGSFGIVYVTEHLSTREEFAVKVIERSELNDKEESSVEREVSILHDFRNVDHIVKLVDFYASPERFYVVQEFAQGGDVFERLAQRTSYTEKDARDLAVHLLEAVEILHSRKLAHRDLKPENLLLREMFDDTAILVADFGFAAYVPPEGLKTRCGTPAFVAPQILIPNCRYDERVDMWSVGCLLYMLIAGYPPFQDRNHRGLFRKVRGADFVFHDMYWKNVSKSAKQLIASMLTLDPRYRCTARMALDKSNWLKMDASLLKEHDLGASLGEIKRFHARRTLKSAIHAVFWTVKYKSKSADDAIFNNRMKNGWDFMTDPKAGDAKNLNENFNDDEMPEVGPIRDPRRHTINGKNSNFDNDFGLKSDGVLLNRLRPSLTFQDIYTLRELLHNGQTAKVYECYHKKTKEVFAVKIIERNDDSKKSVVGRSLTETVLHEVAILDSMDHENIIQVKEFFESDDCFYLVMERMRGGDVFDQIMKKNKFNENEARKLAKVLFEAVAYFHEQGIAHRDLKPQNLLLKTEGDLTSIKVTDFGFACRVHTPNSLTTRCGTPSYVAPEVLKNIPYDQSADIWSVGVILFLLLSGNPPFTDDNQSELFRKIRTADWKFKGEEWENISYDARSLIKKCLVANPLQRIKAKQALKSKWFLGADKDVIARNKMIKEQLAINATEKSGGNQAAAPHQGGDWFEHDEGEVDGLKAVEKVITGKEAEELRHIQNNVPVNVIAASDELDGKIEPNNPRILDAQVKSTLALASPEKLIQTTATPYGNDPKIHGSSGFKGYGTASFSPMEDSPLLRDGIGTSGHSPIRNHLESNDAPLIGTATDNVRRQRPESPEQRQHRLLGNGNMLSQNPTESIPERRKPNGHNQRQDDEATNGLNRPEPRHGVTVPFEPFPTGNGLDNRSSISQVANALFPRSKTPVRHSLEPKGSRQTMDTNTDTTMASQNHRDPQSFGRQAMRRATLPLNSSDGPAPGNSRTGRSKDPDGVIASSALNTLVHTNQHHNDPLPSSEVQLVPKFEKISTRKKHGSRRSRSRGTRRTSDYEDAAIERLEI